MRSPSDPSRNGARAHLFAFTARHEGRQIALIRGEESPEGITVDWEAYSVYNGGTEARRTITFTTQAHARYFTEDALTALEYLGCEIADHNASLPHPDGKHRPGHRPGQTSARRAAPRAATSRRPAASTPLADQG
jgi:hypothetical protein